MIKREFPFWGTKDDEFQVSIGSLDDPFRTVHAQYLPGDLQVEQSASWQPHPDKKPNSKLQVEFLGQEGRTASLELFFDASEDPDDSVTTAIEELTALATVCGKLNRPHHCVLAFGKVHRNKFFRCVIESVSAKYTMFDTHGTPIRATASLKLRETNLVGVKAQ